MKPSNNQRATENSSKTGWTLGFVLVLFILVVIVNSVFCAPAGAEKIQNDDGSLSIAQSRRFTIINLTNDLTLNALDIYGDFEAPLPPLNSIPPGQEANFEVKYLAGTTYAAFARYATTNGNIVTVTMRTKTGVAEITVSFITSGLTSFTDTGNRIAYIYRKY
ncbi:hypothetical protein M3223_14700 [Paenibacillus pasadenensis]|uniref:hypothetical protein n=1 Tax=Paenibacillus pasadenensis TaxID=217090 RepID=UPI00203F41A1|nr:hypothetical protein [Paenibacillus pasadenensis]MCM3748598.1 hypothetical protein [Paenibacillus pasadenensis]